MAVRTWIWVALAAFLAMMVGCGAMVATAVYFVAKRVDVARAVTASSAEEELEEVRARFKNQKPLIEIRDGDIAFKAELDDRASTYNGPPPQSLHVLVWESNEEQLVRVTCPFWVLRFVPGGSMRFKTGRFEFERLSLSVDDLERAGPSLVVDHEDGEHHVLVWTE